MLRAQHNEEEGTEMRKNITRQVAKGAHVPAATALSLVLAFGCMPAVALAEEGSALEAQGITSSTDGSQTVEDTTGTFSEISSTGDHGLVVITTTNNTAATVNGNVTVDHNGTEDTYALQVKEGTSPLDSEINAEATVGGDVAATGRQFTYGVRIDNGTNGSGKLSVKVDGSVTATSNDASPVGVGVGAWTDRAVEVRIGGSVYANNTRSVGTPVGVKINGHSRTHAIVVVGGDVTAETTPQGGNGISINSTGTAKLVVGGAVSGRNGIETERTFVETYLDGINSIVGRSSTEIAVWQIKTDGGNLVYVQDDDDNASKTKTLLGMIDYIVKYGDGQKSFFSELSADKSLGGVSIGTNEYQTAKSGTTLTFSVPDRAGYTLKQVFGLDGGTALTRSADGSYTLVVPDGGGILLRAEWEEIKKENTESEKQTDPKPTDANKPEPETVKPTKTEPEAAEHVKAEDPKPETTEPAETKEAEQKATEPAKAISSTAPAQSSDATPATSDPIPASALALTSAIALACLLATVFARKALGR